MPSETWEEEGLVYFAFDLDGATGVGLPPVALFVVDGSSKRVLAVRVVSCAGNSSEVSIEELFSA